MTNNILHIVVSVVAAILPGLAAYAWREFMKNKRAMDVLKALQPLADAAVQTMKVYGDEKRLDGRTRKENAIYWVKSNLAELGFSEVDYDIIANAVEKSYQEIKKEVKA